MGVWMELRCEGRVDDESFPRSSRQPGCWSHKNAGPMGEAVETQAGVAQALRTLGKEAQASGWIKSWDGWLCPVCAARRRSLSDKPDVSF